MIVLTELMYKDSLFKDSLEVIPETQKNSSSLEQNFWKRWTDLGLIGIIVLPFLTLMIYDR